MPDEPKSAPSQTALCTLGLALLFAADWCSNLIAGMPATDSAIVSGAGRIASVVVLIACAAMPSRARSLARRRSTALAMAALLLAGAFCQTYAGALPDATSTALGCAGALASGATQAFLILTWLARCCSSEPRGIALALAGAYLMTGPTYFILAALPAQVATVVLCAFPACSALVLAFALAREGAQSGARDAGRTRAGDGWTFPIYPVALMVIFKFVFYFSLSLTSGPSMYGPLGILIVATAACAGALLFYERFRVSWLYKAALPCMVAGLLLVSWVHVGSSAATLVANAGNIAFELFVLISLAEACRRFGIEPYWIFGIVQAASAVAGGAGFQAGLAFTRAYPAGSPESNFLMMAVVVGLVALSALFFNERMAGGTFGSEPVAQPAEPGATGEEAAAPADARMRELEARCDRVARRYGLSRREVEILELLAQDLSSARIEEQLVISRNTVKSHTRHIYEKLGVHSREEARALVEAAEG